MRQEQNSSRSRRDSIPGKHNVTHTASHSGQQETIPCPPGTRPRCDRGYCATSAGTTKRNTSPSLRDILGCYIMRHCLCCHSAGIVLPRRIQSTFSVNVRPRLGGHFSADFGLKKKGLHGVVLQVCAMLAASPGFGRAFSRFRFGAPVVRLWCRLTVSAARGLPFELLALFFLGRLWSSLSANRALALCQHGRSRLCFRASCHFGFRPLSHVLLTHAVCCQAASLLWVPCVSFAGIRNTFWKRLCFLVANLLLFELLGFACPGRLRCSSEFYCLGRLHPKRPWSTSVFRCPSCGGPHSDCIPGTYDNRILLNW